MRDRLVPILSFLAKPAVALGGAAIIAVGAIGIAWKSNSAVSTGDYAAAVMEPITGVGGESSNLSFQAPGKIAAVSVTLGQKVEPGTVLVVLDRSALFASRAAAAANLEAAQARLAALKAGTRPEQLNIDETAVAQAQNALKSALQSAYTNADDAVHAKADPLFTDPRTANPVFIAVVPDTQLVNLIQSERASFEPMFSSWSAMLAADSGTANAVAQSEANLRSVGIFLDNVTAAITKAQPTAFVSAATLASYGTNANTGRTNISTSLSALIAADTAYKAATGAVTLAQAGATVNDIAAAQASVDGAQAAQDGIDVSLRQSVLTSPVPGTVTALNAHLGETVSPGETVVSVETTGGTKESALVVPTSSVIGDASGAFVFVKNGSGSPLKTPVTTGLVSENGKTEIISGLSPGQKVLTFGTNK